MAAKVLICSGVVTGSTVYAMVRRGSDGFFLDDADGAFAASPADPYLALAESGTILGMYLVSESRTTWTDGVYQVFFYKQDGGSPAPATDGQPVASGPLYVRDDAEVDPGELDDRFDTVDADIATIDGLVDDLESRLTATRAGYLDNLSAGAVATAADLATVDGIVDDILLDTDEIGAAGAGLTVLATQASVNTVDSNVDQLLLDVADVDALVTTYGANTLGLKARLNKLTETLEAMVRLELAKVKNSVLDLQQSILRGKR